MKIYSVTITHFTDDYKCRGSWSRTLDPKLFTTREKAETYLAGYLKDKIHNEIGCYDTDHELWYYVDEDGELIDQSTQSILDIAHNFFEGEFVPVTLDWKISLLEVE